MAGCATNGMDLVGNFNVSGLTCNDLLRTASIASSAGTQPTATPLCGHSTLFQQSPTWPLSSVFQQGIIFHDKE